MTLCYDILPDGEDKQDRRENEVDQRVRDEHDAEQDDDERQHHQRCIDNRSVTHLLALETYIQAEEDRFEQPGNVDDKTCAHLYEVALNDSPYHHHNDGKERDAYNKDEHRPFLFEVLSAPLLR